MRAAIKIHADGGSSELAPEAVGCFSDRPEGLMEMDGSQKEEEGQRGGRVKKRKFFVVKNDEDSDGSEMSCSSLSSEEDESPLLLSSSARTRPFTDCSPLLTKITDRTKIVPKPSRSIMKRSVSVADDSPSPICSETLSQRSGENVLALTTPTAIGETSGELPAKLKRRRISWDIPPETPGRTELQNGQKKQEISEGNRKMDQISNSLLCRVQG